MTMQPPQFGVKLPGLTTETPGNILYGVTPDDKVIPIKVSDNGTLDVGVTLAGDVEIGAVELKDGSSDTRVTVKTDGSDNAVVVTANVLPLPTGAATEATLSDIETNQTDGTQQTQIVDSFGDIVGSTSNSLDTNLQYVGGAALNLGQQLSVASVPVVIASDQSPVPVTLSGISVGVVSVLAASASGVTVNGTVSVDNFPDTQKVLAASISGLTINGTVSATQSGSWDINDITGTISLPTNAAQEAGGHLESIDSKLNTLGQKGLTNSVPVVLASDQSTIPVDVTDRVARELGRILASDFVFTTESYVTTDTLATTRPINGDLNTRHYLTKQVVLLNTGTKNAEVDVSGSVDNGVAFDVVLVSSATINSGNKLIVTDSSALTHIRVQAKSKNPGNPTTIVSKAYGLGN